MVAGAGAVFRTRTPCLKLLRAGMPLLASPRTGLRVCPCCHPPGWGGWLSERGPPNPGWFVEGVLGATSLALCSEEGALMGMRWERGAGPAAGGFPCSTVVLKMGAKDEIAVEKPIEG